MVAASGANQFRNSRFGDKEDPAQSMALGDPIPFDKVITMSNVGGAVEFGSVAIAALPVGDVVVLAGVLSLDLIESSANIVDTFTPTYSLGTTATADNALATTEIDLLTAKTAGAATGGVSPHQKQVLDGAAVVASGTAASKYIDNNAAGKAVFLNVTIPDAQQTGAATLRVRGSLRLAVAGLGKNS